MTKFAKVFAGFALAAVPATAAMAAEMPTKKQCEAGYKSSYTWSKAEFDKACQKFRTNSAPSTSTK